MSKFIVELPVTNRSIVSVSVEADTTESAKTEGIRLLKETFPNQTPLHPENWVKVIEVLGR